MTADANENHLHLLLSQLIAAFFTAFMLTLIFTITSGGPGAVTSLIFINILIGFTVIGIPVSVFIQWFKRKRLSHAAELITLSMYLSAGFLTGLFILMLSGETAYSILILTTFTGSSGLFYLLLRLTTLIRSG